jgi:hypothetical protein
MMVEGIGRDWRSHGGGLKSIADKKSFHATCAAYMQPYDRHEAKASERPRIRDQPVSDEKMTVVEVGGGHNIALPTKIVVDIRTSS